MACSSRQRRSACFRCPYVNASVPILSSSNNRLVLLQVERPLVLQPPPVVLDRCDLLAIVIRDRVLRARSRGVGSVALDAAVEALLFLQSSSSAHASNPNVNLVGDMSSTHLSNPPIPPPPSRPRLKPQIAHTRPTQPASRRNRKRRQPQHNDRIQT